MTGSAASAIDLIGWLGNARLQLRLAQRGLGYHAGDVDVFLGTIVDGLRRGELPDPQQVRLIQFRTVRMGSGYDRQPVDALLDELQQRLGNVSMPDDQARQTSNSAAELIELIRLARFGTTRDQGYDQQDVDTFLDKVTTALRRGDQLTTEQIRGAQFRITRLRPGYVQHDVEDLLQQLEQHASGDGF